MPENALQPSPAVSVSITDGLAFVTIDNPPVNATSQAVRQGLLDAVTATDADPKIRAVILSAVGRTFVAGADVNEFGKPPTEPYLPDVIDAIEAAQKPWIAALHGTVLGGGLELAMGCHMRVAAPETRLGLPEVTLGLIPGAGGTLRLPRLVPATRALELIVTGKPVSAPSALADGLIDEIAGDSLLDCAVNLAGSAHLSRTMDRPVRDEDQEGFQAVKSRLVAKARGQQSPKEAAEAVERALRLPVDRARREERETFLRLKDGDQSAALRHIFFAERKSLSDPRTKRTARPVERIGVIGGGTMGAGIAAACLMQGCDVTLIEQTTERADQARQTATDTLNASMKRGVIKDAAPLLQRLRVADRYDMLAEAEIVIEAVFEDMDVKKTVFRQIEAVVSPETIIATNTSYLDVNEIAATLQDPSRAIGLHFFSPAHIMKLLEIVLPDAVAEDVVATGAMFAKRLKKIGVFSGVCDGFIGNRIMSAYRQEADFLIEDGAEPAAVDTAMKAFGFGMGIFEMQDLAGLDIAWAMRKRRAATRPKSERYVVIADRLCEAGRFGRKTKAGWYDYDEGGRQSSDKVAEIIGAARAAKEITARDFSQDEIMARILARMRSEADAVLKEGIARSAADIDVVMVNGYGFPRWRGGPCFGS